MGVPAELIDVGDKFIFVKGAKASFYNGKEVYHSLDVWYSHWDDDFNNSGIKLVDVGAVK